MLKKLESGLEISLGIVSNEKDGTFGIEVLFKLNDENCALWFPASFAKAFGQALIAKRQEATEANRSRTLN